MGNQATFPGINFLDQTPKAQPSGRSFATIHPSMTSSSSMAKFRTNGPIKMQMQTPNQGTGLIGQIQNSFFTMSSNNANNRARSSVIMMAKDESNEDTEAKKEEEFVVTELKDEKEDEQTWAELLTKPSEEEPVADTKVEDKADLTD